MKKILKTGGIEILSEKFQQTFRNLESSNPLELGQLGTEVIMLNI
jgi:hypothetical protein